MPRQVSKRISLSTRGYNTSNDDDEDECTTSESTVDSINQDSSSTCDEYYRQGDHFEFPGRSEFAPNHSRNTTSVAAMQKKVGSSPLKSVLKKRDSVPPSTFAKELLSYSGQDLVGPATAKRLNVSNTSWEGQEVEIASKTSSSSSSSSVSSCDTVCDTASTQQMTTDCQVDSDAAAVGMSKWIYPRKESFIVDMNNPPAQSRTEEEKKAKKVEDQKIEVKKEEEEPKIYYPSRSPYHDRNIQKLKRRGFKSPWKYWSFKTKLLILLALIVIGLVLYFALLIQVVDQHTLLLQVASSISRRAANKSAIHSVANCSGGNWRKKPFIYLLIFDHKTNLLLY